MGFTQPLVTWVPGTVQLGVKLTERAVYYSPRLMQMLRMNQDILALSCVPSWRAKGKHHCVLMQRYLFHFQHEVTPCQEPNGSQHGGSEITPPSTSKQINSAISSSPMSKEHLRYFQNSPLCKLHRRYFQKSPLCKLHPRHFRNSPLCKLHRRYFQRSPLCKLHSRSPVQFIICHIYFLLTSLHRTTLQKTIFSFRYFTLITVSPFIRNFKQNCMILTVE